MNIIIFGATGKTGKAFVEMALENGHKMTAFVRSPEKIQVQHSNLTVVQGSVLDLNQVTGAIKGHDAVVSCLGGEANKKSDMVTRMLTTIVDAMKANNMDRIAYVSTAGINKEIPGVIINIFISLFLKNAIEDHKGAANYIIANGLKYTIARPLALTDGPLTKTYRKTTAGVPAGGRNISRADVADFLLSALETDTHIGESMGLAY